MTHTLPSYAAVVEQLSIAVLVFDSANTLVYMNNTAQEILEVSDRQALGGRAKHLFVSDTFDIQCYLNKVRGEGLNIEHNVSFINLGDKRFNISISPVTFGGDNAGHVLVEMNNTDHFLEITRGDAIISQNKLATDMLRGLAHEIKNPLAGLRGAAQLLSSELNEELSDYTRVIIDEADRLRDLVDRMLGPTKVVKQEAVNIHVILERVRQLVQAELVGRLMIETDYDPSIPEITCDKDQLIQAVLNIVRNATQAITKEGKIILKTRVQRNFIVGEENYKLGIKIDIIDNGPGIPDELQSTVFYPLVTGRVDGTGLGLSIAQTNVQRHKGFIELSSKPGHTVFSILLPFGSNSGR
ncbi:MAG: PAS domain-containing sensor histidine kinase [Piscirickettsiaceae bacterium]|nr:MAG: PAS domain-containing sensor histidine kinase [Piscirickettsiaceae bacterium]PCI66635.1 MAG: PAS domain-containing sensor histidine kinase [Piscirickettsiaceae bacterium]